MSHPLDLDPIKARENGATPGPWRLPQEQSCGNSVVLCDTLGDSDGMGFCNSVVGMFLARSGRISTFEARIQEADANAAFCAHARQDVPALIAEVERLRSAPVYVLTCSVHYEDTDIVGLFATPELARDAAVQHYRDRHGSEEAPKWEESRSGGAWLADLYANYTHGITPLPVKGAAS